MLKNIIQFVSAMFVGMFCAGLYIFCCYFIAKHSQTSQEASALCFLFTVITIGTTVFIWNLDPYD